MILNVEVNKNFSHDEYSYDVRFFVDGIACYPCSVQLLHMIYGHGSSTCNRCIVEMFNRVYI